MFQHVLAPGATAPAGAVAPSSAHKITLPRSGSSVITLQQPGLRTRSGANTGQQQQRTQLPRRPLRSGRGARPTTGGVQHPRGQGGDYHPVGRPVAQPVPPGLVEAEVKADGKESAHRTQGSFVALTLRHGYVWDGPNWGAEEKARTRLGRADGDVALGQARRWQVGASRTSVRGRGITTPKQQVENAARTTVSHREYLTDCCYSVALW